MDGSLVFTGLPLCRQAHGLFYPGVVDDCNLILGRFLLQVLY